MHLCKRIVLEKYTFSGACKVEIPWKPGHQNKIPDKRKTLNMRKIKKISE